MKKPFVIFLGAILTAAFSFGQDKLTPSQQDWLDTVAPIITRIERDVFLKLKNAAERDKFIQFFWRQRDAKFGGGEGGFYKEYMARVDFADRSFKIGTSKRGSRTDRGYYYLLLGKPLERHFYTTQSKIWPLELWFYKGEEEYGLPPYFYLLFYQPEGMGEYRLYRPGLEGPEKLIIPSMVDRSVTRDSAYETIREINSELGGATLSYIPGERPVSLSSFSSDTLVANVRGLPEKKFSDAYARSFLAYKDYVETDYSHNFVECSAAVRVFEQDGQFFVHWALEPEKMNFDSVQGAIYATYELVLRLEKPDGTPLLEKTEEIPLRLTPDQYKAHERERFAFQDILPVIAGDTRLLLLLKNKTTKDFMTFDARISVPEEIRNPRLGDVLLYHQREDIPEAQRKGLQAFALSGRRYTVNARNEFLPGESLGLFVQALRFPKDAASPNRSVRLDIAALAPAGPGSAATPPKAAAPLSRTLALRDALAGDGQGLDLGPLPLTGLAPGYYAATVTVLEPDGRPSLTRKENFILLARSAPVVPWTYARLHPAFPDVEQLYLLGSQYFLDAKYDRARELLERAMTLRDDPRLRLLLGRTLYAQSRYADSASTVAPLFAGLKVRDAGKLLALDRSALGDWAEAVRLCEELLKEGTEVSVLNLAADGYLRLGRPEQALPLLRKSLELVPNQPAMKEMEDRAVKAIK